MVTWGELLGIAGASANWNYVTSYLFLDSFAGCLAMTVQLVVGTAGVWLNNIIGW